MLRRFFFKEPLAPSLRGRGLIAGGVLSMRNLLREFLPTRSREALCLGFVGAKLVRSTDLAMAIPRIHNQGIYNQRYTREALNKQAAELLVREKIKRL